MKAAKCTAALLSCTLDVVFAAESTAGKCGMGNLVASQVLSGWNELSHRLEPTNIHDVPFKTPYGGSAGDGWYVKGSTSTTGSTYMVWCFKHAGNCAWESLGHCAIAKGTNVFTYTWSTCTDG